MACHRRARGATTAYGRVFSEPRATCKRDEKSANVIRFRVVDWRRLRSARRCGSYVPHGVPGRRFVTKQPITPLASAERRAGIYERDDDVIGLLWYSTHSILDVP